MAEGCGQRQFSRVPTGHGSTSQRTSLCQPKSRPIHSTLNRIDTVSLALSLSQLEFDDIIDRGVSHFGSLFAPHKRRPLIQDFLSSFFLRARHIHEILLFNLCRPFLESNSHRVRERRCYTGPIRWHSFHWHTWHDYRRTYLC